MGQLEKYGLYVLCLVIFLIIGVAIWGQPVEVPPPGAHNQLELSAGPGAAGKKVEEGKKNEARTPAPMDLSQALGPGKKPEPVKPEGQKPEAGKNETAKNEAKPGAAPGNTPAPGATDSERRSYTVKNGDTFEHIAREQLGDAHLHGEIAKLNPKVEPTKLRANQTLVLPSKAELAKLKGGKDAAAPKDAKADTKTAAEKVAATGDKAAGKDAKDAKVDTKTEKGGAKTYTVAKGDTFEGIARRELGNAHRVDELKTLNPTIEPTRLKVGMAIRLPAK